MRRAALILFILLTASAAQASPLLASLLPNQEAGTVGDVGRGIGVVFSPDLSVPGNCRFYLALGFACFQEADWARVLDGISRYNALYPERAIRTLVLETHGTNGNGLKLQHSYDPDADRSYISVGALQQRVALDGVQFIVISACNSGRLLRPAIYNALDPNNGDKLFLPATCGIFSASADFDPQGSSVTIVSPAASHLESTLVGKWKELTPVTRWRIAESAKARGVKLPKTFAISDMMMQLLLRDPTLELRTSGYIEDLSRKRLAVATSESLFQSFIARLNEISKAQGPPRASTPRLAGGRLRSRASQ